MALHVFASKHARGNLNKSTKVSVTDLILFQVICLPCSGSAAGQFIPQSLGGDINH